MGQQQLLLIVLGVIIVGIAVVVGINVFTASSEEAAKDAIVADCTTIGAMAQQYYKKPTELGGGGGSFAGFTVPTLLAENANGTYAAVPNAAVDCVITGTPPASAGYTSFTTVTTTVTPTGISSVINTP